MSNTCNDINKALNNLAKKIDAQNACCESNRRAIQALTNRVKKLEDKIGKPEERTQGKNQQQDLSQIYRRLSKIEKDVLDLGGIVKSIIDDIKDILDSVDEHNQNATQSQNVFSNILKFFIDE